MIKLIKNSEINKTTRYRFYGIRCNCCNSTNNVNVLEIRAENSSGGTIIDICDKCLIELKELMKKIFTLILAFFPLCNLMAQSEWELPNSSVPTEKTTKTKTKKENTSIAKEDNSKVVEIKEEDKPYLEGAVPEVEGKIVFSRTINIPNKNASEIYDKTYQYLEQFTKSNTSLPGSRIVIVNKKQHIIAATINEWLVFSNNFFSIDRAQFFYTLIATCKDNELLINVERIKYKYEIGRPSELKTTAEELISDKVALSKDKTKVKKAEKKFRYKTIDRVKEIMDNIQSNVTL